MSITTGRAKVVGAMKDLQQRWERIREQWDDPVSADLERTVIEAMEPRVRAAAGAMEKMYELLSRARRECE